MVKLTNYKKLNILKIKILNLLSLEVTWKLCAFIEVCVYLISDV